MAIYRLGEDVPQLGVETQGLSNEKARNREAADRFVFGVTPCR